MSVDEFERVRAALRAEEHALAEELDRIDADAKEVVDVTAQYVRDQLATQAQRIRAAIAQQREEAAAAAEETLAGDAFAVDDLATAYPADEETVTDDAGVDGAPEADVLHVATDDDAPTDDVERGD